MIGLREILGRFLATLASEFVCTSRSSCQQFGAPFAYFVLIFPPPSSSPVIRYIMAFFFRPMCPISQHLSAQAAKLEGIYTEKRETSNGCFSGEIVSVSQAAMFYEYTPILARSTGQK